MTATQPRPESSPGIWPMYRAMVGVGLMCGLLIVSVFVATGPAIERNQAEALQRAIFHVLPAASASATFRPVEGGWRRVAESGPSDGSVVHAAYDDGGRLLGIAVEARAMGYQDVIRLLYGYSFRDDAIVGIRILESRETPGLGDRIETDRDFLASFERLDVSLAPDGNGLLHPIEGVKHGAKEHPWQVDGITGATVSSAAVATALSRSAALWIAPIRRHLDDFRKVD